MKPHPATTGNHKHKFINIFSRKKSLCTFDHGAGYGWNRQMVLLVAFTCFFCTPHFCPAHWTCFLVRLLLLLFDWLIVFLNIQIYFNWKLIYFSPCPVCFVHKGKWLGSLSLSWPTSFSILLSHSSCWGGWVTEWLSGHLADNQGQLPTDNNATDFYAT